MSQDNQKELLALLPRLDKLSREWGRLNLFDITGMATQEIKHSRVIEFLLDPSSDHGLDDVFLKRLLVAAVMNLPENTGDLVPSPLRIMLNEYSDAEVRREWMEIDLIVISQSNKMVFAIENKVRAKEGKGQLTRYREKIEAREEFKDYKKIHAFLTPYGEEGADASWAPITYEDVLTCLAEAQEDKKNQIPSEMQLLLRHYTELIRRNVLMNDEQLANECREIYRKYKNAIGLIMKYGATNNFIDAANQFAKKHPDLTPSGLRPNRVFFTPEKVAKHVTDLDMVWWDQKKPFGVWFGIFNDTKIGIIIEVGPFGTSQLDRSELARKLLVSVSEKPKKITERYTRIYTQYESIDEDASDEAIYQKMEQLYEAVKPKLDKAIPVVCEFFRANT